MMYINDHISIFLFMIIIIYYCQISYASEETLLGQAAMTTVLARPLGGYGLTPLIFEPSHTIMEGSSSNSVPTKIRKSPVYELSAPQFDEDLPSTMLANNNEHSKLLKKMNYDTLTPVSTSTSATTLKSSFKQSKPMSSLINNNKITSSFLSSPKSASNSNSNSNYFQSVMDLLKIKEQSSASSSSYNSIASPMGGGGGFKGGFGGSSGGGYQSGGSGGGFFNSMSSSSFGNSGHGYGGFGGGNNMGNNGPSGPVTAAIQSVRSVEVNEVQDSYENSEPQVIDIPPSAMPIVINFRTSASQIQIHQSHEPSEPREVQETQSEDEPHFLRHSVTKPVIQEVHEIIMPYRRVIQEIRPVEEEVKTIVARQAQGKGGVSGSLTGSLGSGLNMMSGFQKPAGGFGDYNAASLGGGGSINSGPIGNGIRIISGASITPNNGGGSGGYGGANDFGAPTKGGHSSSGGYGEKKAAATSNALQYAIDKLTSTTGGVGGDGKTSTTNAASASNESNTGSGNKYKASKK